MSRMGMKEQDLNVPLLLSYVADPDLIPGCFPRENPDIIQCLGKGAVKSLRGATEAFLCF